MPWKSNALLEARSEFVRPATAGFRRIELTSAAASEGEYRCPGCDEVLERFDGSNFVAYRLTVQPSLNGERN